MRSPRTRTRTHTAPPRPRPASVPAALRDDPSSAALSHSEHFLYRVLRCEVQDRDRAMRLYHHSQVVRELVPELMENLLPGYDRAAIPLRKDGPTPHVVVTRTGAFVTCLSADMSLGGLPVLPFSALDHEIARVERETGRQQRRAEVHAALTPERLELGLLRGPGGVTREMVLLVEREPWAYEPSVYQTYITSIADLATCLRLKERFGYSAAIFAEETRLQVRLKQCAYLVGVLDGEVTEVLEPHLITSYAPVLWEMAMAAARKPGRGTLLLRGLDAGGEHGEWVRSAAFDALLVHCYCFPEEARWVIPRLRREAPPTVARSWFRSWHTGERASRSTEELVSWFREAWQLLREVTVDEELPVESPFWDFTCLDMLSGRAMLPSMADNFPPAALSQRVARAFAAHLRAAPRRDPQQARLQPLVRIRPAVSRNAPCPCGSGAKFKRCCADKPTVNEAPPGAAEAAPTTAEAPPAASPG